MINHSVDATSHDGLTPEQFQVPGKQAETYRYPFSQEQPDFSRTENVPWEDSLPEADRGPDGIYRKDGFDISEAVKHTDGVIVEIGGPTTRSYNFLHNVDLPSRPHILNARGSRTEMIGSGSMTAVDKLALSALADVRALPLANESVGMLMCANLPGMDEKKLQGIGRNPDLSNDQKIHETFNTINKMYNDAADKLESGDIAALETHESPRLAAIAQAKRALKPGGLFMMQGAESRDVAFAKALGLDLVMHTPRSEHDWKGRGFEVIKEAVFQKAKN